MRLKDKIAIITGAGTGIGEAVAHKFARQGPHLLLSGLPNDPVPAWPRPSMRTAVKSRPIWRMSQRPMRPGPVWRRLCRVLGASTCC
jgi:NAD(P)-dependent dehydrogenase (short-subunit alcohol dehydrogenase family)